MIPKSVHYCWFGRKPLPESAEKCIRSWRKYLPDYEIKLWNEDNFDVNIIQYTREAYDAKKYAFVSDYARFWILYNYGGLYFDTDVELIKPIDDIIDRGPFMGCERSADSVESALRMGVAPGLGLGVNPGLGLYAEILNYYNSLNFLNADGIPDTSETVVTITSRILCKYGLELTDKIQHCAGVWIYPKDYFSPKDVDSKLITITDNTRSIHHYDATWAEWYDRAAGERGPRLEQCLGHSIGSRLNFAIYIWQRYGLTGIVKKILKR